MQNGADVSLKNAEGKTAMDIASEGLDEEDLEDSEVIAALKGGAA